MPRPNAIQAAQRFRKRLEAQELAAFQRMATIYGGIFRSVQDEVAALAEEIAAIDGPDRSKVVKLARLGRILNQIEDQVDKFGGTVVNEVTLAQRLAIESAVSNATELIDKSLPPDLPDSIRRAIRASFTTLPADAIEAAAGLLDDDSPLVVALEKQYAPAVRAQVEQHFLDGIAKGMNPRRIAILLNKNFANALGEGLTRARRTVRTAQIKSYQLANHATYVENSHIVPAWIWHAQLDSRTCMSCIAQHGSEHPITETLRDHHNGRCAPLPKTITYADLGLNIKERREPVQSGEEWFKAQSRATQREMMGGAMYRAWKDGQVGFGELSKRYDDPVYGELIREASLKDILGSKAKNYYKQAGSKPKPSKTKRRVLKPGNFTTPEQAQQWLKDRHNIDADLSGFDDKQINEISAGVDKVANVYKSDLPINKIEQVKGTNYAARAGGKSIKINTDTFNDTLLEEIADTDIARYRSSKRRLERARRQLEEMGTNISPEYRQILTERIARLEVKVNNFKPVPFGASRDYGDLIIHEIAHEIEIDLSTGVFSDIIDFLPPSKMKALGIDFKTTLSARLDAIAHNQGLSISEYAATNSQEYFAEAFVKYIQGETGNIHPDLLSIFKEITR